jgi:transposase-like protein
MDQPKTPSAISMRCPSCNGTARVQSVSLRKQQRTISYACEDCQRRWDITSAENAVFLRSQT